MAPSTSYELPSYTSTVHRAVYPAIDPSNPSNSAAGKVVVVTGGGSGIGKGIASAFVTAGAKAVAILGRRADTLAEAKKDLEASGSTQILTFTADILDQPALENAFAQTAKAAGPIDVVVANAGYLTAPGKITEATDAEDYFKAFDVNIRGLFLTFRAFHPHRSAASTFISLNTSVAHAWVIPGCSAYAASKAGQGVLAAYLDVENPDVRVVSFHPGVIETPMFVKSGFKTDMDDISLPSSFAVWLASPAADWTGGRFLWSHWDVEELGKLQDQVKEKDHLRLNLDGWGLAGKPTLV